MKDYATQFVGRVGRVTAIVGVLIVVTALTAAVVVGIRLFSSDEYTITAQFPATPGLYHDNDVDILGVPSGHVVKVTPKAKYVEVVLMLPSSVKIPADAKAVVMAPNPVSDRFIELTPPYTKGPKLKAGAVLGLDAPSSRWRSTRSSPASARFPGSSVPAARTRRAPSPPPCMLSPASPTATVNTCTTRSARSRPRCRRSPPIPTTCAGSSTGWTR